MALVDIATTAVWLLPASRAKNALLRKVGHDVAPSARAAMNLVLRVRRFTVGDGASVGRFNLFKDLSAVELAPGSRIGRMNLISAHPVYARHYPDGARLSLGEKAKVTSRHSVDCSGGVTVGALASVAGRQTLILTHSVDLARDAQVAYPVVVGERSFVGARCLILGGASLPERSVLAAGSVLTRSGKRDRGVWAGAPATWRAPKEGLWFDREDTSTHRLYVPATGETHEGVI